MMQKKCSQKGCLSAAFDKSAYIEKSHSERAPKSSSGCEVIQANDSLNRIVVEISKNVRKKGLSKFTPT